VKAVFQFVLGALGILVAGCGLFGEGETLIVEIKSTPRSEESQLILFDGESAILEFPDREIGIELEEEGAHARWPLDGDATGASFEVTPINPVNGPVSIDGYETLHIRLSTQRDDQWLDWVVFVPRQGEEWKYEFGGGLRAAEGIDRDSEFTIPLLEVPNSIKNDLATIKIKVYYSGLPQEGDVILQEVFASD
jgi:hypothetical protein